MRLEVRHLELLLAVERAGSISGAARELGTDQPHVTRQLRRIEEQLGHAVFERTGSGTRATAEGAEVLERARVALRAFDEVTESRDEETVGDVVRVLYRWLEVAPVVSAIRAAHPDVAVTVAAAEPAGARAELLAGTADLFLMLRIPHMRSPAPGPLVEIELVTDPGLVYLPAHHPLADRDEIDLRDLADEDWITGNDADTIRMAREECRLLGGFEPRISFRSADNDITRSLLNQGLGVVFGAESSPRRGGFVARRYRGATPAHWVLLQRPGVLPARTTAAISDAVRAEHRRRIEEAIRIEGGSGGRQVDTVR